MDPKQHIGLVASCGDKFQTLAATCFFCLDQMAWNGRSALSVKLNGEGGVTESNYYFNSDGTTHRD
jgi:hypothetical protein